MKRNPLKKLLINDEKPFYLYLKEYEIDLILESLDIYRKLLEQKGGQENEIKWIENIQRKIDISMSQSF